MFVSKVARIEFKRNQMNSMSNASLPGRTMSEVYQNETITHLTRIAKEYREMETVLAANGFAQLTVLNKSTPQEAAFEAAVIDGLGSTLIQEVPSVPGFGHTNQANSATATNLKIAHMVRHYKFGDAETLPLYLKIGIGMIGHSSTGTGYNYLRPFAVVEFYSDADFTNLIDKYSGVTLSIGSDIYSPNSSGNSNGIRVAGFSYAANDNNLILCPMSYPEVGVTSLDKSHWGAVTAATFNNGLTKPIMLSKVKCYGIDTEMEYVAVCHLPSHHNNQSTSTNESALVTTDSYSSGTALAHREKFLTPLSVELRMQGIGVPRSMTDELNQARPMRPHYFEYFYLDNSGFVYEFDKVYWGTIPTRTVIGQTEHEVRINGEMRRVCYCTALAPSTLNTDANRWSERAQGIMIDATT